MWVILRLFRIPRLRLPRGFSRGTVTGVVIFIALVALFGALAPRAEHRQLPAGDHPPWITAVCQGVYNDYGPVTSVYELSAVSSAVGGHTYEVHCANGFRETIAH